MAGKEKPRLGGNRGFLLGGSWDVCWVWEKQYHPGII